MHIYICRWGASLGVYIGHSEALLRVNSISIHLYMYMYIPAFSPQTLHTPIWCDRFPCECEHKQPGSPRCATVPLRGVSCRACRDHGRSIFSSMVMFYSTGGAQALASTWAIQRHYCSQDSRMTTSRSGGQREANSMAPPLKGYAISCVIIDAVVNVMPTRTH